jgi:hypothetical protein
MNDNLAPIQDIQELKAFGYNETEAPFCTALGIIGDD